MRLTMRHLLLPRSLSGRILWILILGMVVSQAASLLLHLRESAALMSGGHLHTDAAALQALPQRFFWHVALTLGAAILLASVAVRWATRPLKQLADAANAFAHDLDAPPMAEAGPSEVRRAAEAFNFMQQRLRGLVVERGRALAAVSHDLRTPLTRMRLRAELVGNEDLQARLIADIDAMQGMVNSVLAYLRGLEDSDVPQAIDMEALVSSLVEDSRALGRQLELAERPPGAPRPPPFTGKLSLLRRAIANLIDNALAHGRQVTVSLTTFEGLIEILVDDDGPGIPPEDLERVMEPYVRLDEARSMSTGGVGLGLAIARDAAAYHAGQLLLTNRDGGGLRARLRLPLQERPR